MCIRDSPKVARCFACESIAPSRINLLYQGLFFIIAILAATLFAYLPCAWRLCSNRSEQYFGEICLMLIALAIRILFYRRAHSCAACGSEFLREI